MATITVTAKLKILPSDEQKEMLLQTMRKIKTACNAVSAAVHASGCRSQQTLNASMYGMLRSDYGLRSQMAQSVMKTVLAKYKSMDSNGVKNTIAVFKKPEYDLVWNRDYSLCKDIFSVNSLFGRIKVPFQKNEMERYFDGSWRFGTAKLVLKKGKFFLHIPVTTDIDVPLDRDIKNVVGIDLGINFLAVSYDTSGKTVFYSGRAVKQKRARYKQIRRSLQMRGTASARYKLKQIGSRENRWMTDINHQVSKALVRSAKPNTLFVLEDLNGVRSATERVRQKDRYVSVSWAFAQLGMMIEYKTALYGHKAVKVNPKHTSQSCPHYGHTAKTNRDKKRHAFCCQSCGYRSNDDRIGAMNLHAKGTQYLAEVTKRQAVS